VGAEPYQYVVPFEADAQVALEKLRGEIFKAGRYRGANRGAKSPEAALEQAGDSGTASILDISKVQEEPDYCCAAPLTNEETQRYFGVAEPTVQMVEGCDDLWEELERGQARYLAVVDDSGARQLMFVGYSFD
jgi:hypothetical protein